MQPRTVGIFVFEDVEVLDFAGPFEVFSRTRLEQGADSRRSDESAPFRVLTVAPTAQPIRATGGLTVTPDHGFDEAPSLDVVVIPGGFGTRPLLEDPVVLGWIGSVAERAELVTSVCTGSLLLAKAGLLDGRRATTHWLALDLLEKVGKGRVTVERERRFVDDGLVTSAGVAAGIDMAFWVVEKLCGKEIADETARNIEYPRRPDDQSRFESASGDGGKDQVA